MSNTAKKIATVVGVLVLGFVFYRFLSTPPKTPIAQDFNFHPDSVHEFSWTLKGQSFKFKRPGRSKPWEPGVDAQAVQKKLNALGNLQLEKMAAPKDGLEIEVGFAPGNSWKGIYNDHRFVWTDGLRAGEGFKADPEVSRIFEEGVLGFEIHQWSWCEARPVKMNVKIEKASYELFMKNRQWVLKVGGREVKPDPTMIERWLGRNCLVAVDYFRDLKNFPIGLKLADGHFNIEFEGGAKRDYDLKSGYFLVDGERGVASMGFTKALEDLTSIPHP